jgi:hypothetical protein
MGHYKQFWYFKLQIKKYLMCQIFYSVNIKYLYKLIDQSDKICNLKLK